MAQQATLTDSFAVDCPAALPAHLPVGSRLKPLETRQGQVLSTTLTDHLAGKEELLRLADRW